MPTYRSITISLVSQFDISCIPEYTPPAAPNDPFSTALPLIDTDRSLISVYIPTYPASQFWLSYSISPPNPPKQLYYFKLYINGRSIASWGCGASDDFKGKTMFGIFDSTQGSGTLRQSLFERRVLCFSPEAETAQSEVPDSLSDVMEIKVFRSKGRKSIVPELQEYQSLPGVQHIDKKGTQRQADDGINLVSAGFLSVKNPRRYYRYALIDPLDHPFATFHYYYRSWDQLVALGVVSPPPPSTVTSSIRSLTPQQRPVSPDDSESILDDSENVLASLASLSHSLENTIAEPNSTGTRPPVRTDRNNSNDSNNSTGTVIKLQSPDTSTASQKSTDSGDGSPLSIPRLNPLRMHRPPTPPPRPSPTKAIAQLPPMIPPTISPSNLSLTSINALNTLTPKASFTSLIRTHIPDPDSSASQLKPPSEKRPTESTRTSRSANMGVLMDVVNMAKKRRSSRASEVGSDASSSGGVSQSSEKKKRESGGEEVMGSESKREKEERKREKKMRRDESRKLHLWEEI